MANVIAIIQDDRVRHQTEQYLQQLGMEDLRFATFKSHQEFAALYFSEPPPDENKEEKTPRLFNEVHLLIFALDSIGEKSASFIDRVKLNFKRYKHWPAAAPMRMVMLKYEDDGISKLDVLHPQLDDLVYLPLDRLVFMQKLEIFLTLPKTARPRFLFTQEVKQNIEISKITKLDRLSDVGLAIRNPMPLKKGLPGHFYVQLQGEKTRLEVKGKVFRSEPHPEFPGQFLVYFSFFGLPKTDLSTIRRSLSKAARYQSLYNDDRTVFRFRPDDLFSSASEQKVFAVTVIDPDIQQAANLAQQVSKDMDRLRIVSESSYQLFLHRYFDNVVSDRPPKATEEKDFYQPQIRITVSISDLKLISVDPAPGKEDRILGHLAADLFSTPDRWLDLIADKASRLVLEESVQFVTRGRSSEKLLIIQDSENNPCAVNVKIRPGSAENQALIEFYVASLSDIAAKLTTVETTKELDALVIDSAFVPEDVSSWVQGLRQRAAQVGLTKEPGQLKFFIVADPQGRISENLLTNPDILGLFLKPVDTRQLGFLLSEYLPNKNTVYQYENLGWSKPNLPLHVSKAMQLEALSEFGATLKSKQQMAPGTMVYLRKSIFDNAPNQCLAARVYACVEHPSEKDHFQVLTTYFGINDAFLKFARTWIRENYASQKGKENG